MGRGNAEIQSPAKSIGTLSFVETSKNNSFFLFSLSFGNKKYKKMYLNSGGGAIFP